MASCFDTATLADQSVKAWQAEVAALPVRKQRIWKQRVLDSHGCLSVVRYVPGGHDLGFGHVTYFAQRLSAKEAADRGVPPGSWIPVVSVAQRADLHEVVSRATGGRTRLIDIDTQTPFVPTYDGAGYLDSFMTQLSSNLTGNHQPHKHRVSVPTRAGEPVRG